ncbi:hypothetical protein SDC9_175502 [bioreactor metagenome]|uniref:Uncharacterized protein n=1 Tax=bioreactor metagenome TaxID=1076179 RepID=A0A645GWN3_9ZZZZ
MAILTALFRIWIPIISPHFSRRIRLKSVSSLLAEKKQPTKRGTASTRQLGKPTRNSILPVRFMIRIGKISWGIMTTKPTIIVKTITSCCGTRISMNTGIWRRHSIIPKEKATTKTTNRMRSFQNTICPIRAE